MAVDQSDARLEGLKSSICSSHRTSGSAQHAEPFETAVRVKAYELWELGGRLHGKDQDNWYRATDLLSRNEDNAAQTASLDDREADSATDTILGSMQRAVAAAAEALHAITGVAALKPAGTAATGSRKRRA